jgi:zinc protease
VFFLAIAACWIASVDLPAQAPASFKFPKVETRTLPNGLRVVMVEDHSVPVVAVRAAVRVDSLSDPAGKEGLSVLTLSTLGEATATRSTTELEDAQALLGTRVTATRFTTVTANYAGALGLMADMLMHPAFPAATIERRKGEQIDGQRRVSQARAMIPRRIFYMMAYGPDYPHLRSSTEASVSSITRDDVLGFHDAHVRPDNTTLVLVGDIRPAEAMRTIEKAFAAWPKGATVVSRTFPAPPAPKPTTVYLFDRPGETQSLVYVGQIGPLRSTPDRPTLEALAAVTGSLSASRLQQNLRDRHGYYYSGNLFSFQWLANPIPSVGWGQANIASAKTDSALIEWLGELRDIRGPRPPDANEMRIARSVVAALPSRIETPDAIAAQLLIMLQNDEPFTALDRYAERVNAVTSADMVAAAARYVDPSHLIIVVAGDRKTVEPLLRAANIGPVVVVDQNGKPLTP